MESVKSSPADTDRWIGNLDIEIAQEFSKNSQSSYKLDSYAKDQSQTPNKPSYMTPKLSKFIEEEDVDADEYKTTRAFRDQ